MIFNLDQHFDPFPTDHPLEFESFTFPGGEPHLRLKTLPSRTEEVWITHRIQSFNDVGPLLLAVDALRRIGVENIRLFLPYFPGARQDRVMVPGEALTAQVYAKLINQLSLDEVVIFDPHSDVTPALLERCVVLNNHGFIQQVLPQLPDSFHLVAPDAGAQKKVYDLAAQLNISSVVTCDKKRDPRTGALSGFRVHHDDLAEKACLIVDDICDGGGTFLGLAEALQLKNAGPLYLAVSHGIFSKGVKKLSAVFEDIFTTDSLPQQHTKVQQIPLASFYCVEY